MSRSRAEMIEETRGKLLATARESFRRSGYAGTSMDDLTAAAGLTRGALYHHFGDKQGLLAAVAAQIDREMEARLQAIAHAALPMPGPPCANAAGPIWRWRPSLKSAGSCCRTRARCWAMAAPPRRNSAPRRWARCCRL